jgi:hypothetical protein
MSPKIVISYRRQDSPGMMRAIFERLTLAYGKDSVFVGIDIPYGTDFRSHIDEALQGCDILVAVIGPRWAGAGRRGRARIKEEDDWVRLEVETALKRGIAVIPVLVDGASMPAPAQLPDSLREFHFVNAATVDGGRDFSAHMRALIQRMDQVVGLAPEARDPGTLTVSAATTATSPSHLGFGLAFLALAALCAWMLYVMASDGQVHRFFVLLFSAGLLFFLFISVRSLRHYLGRVTSGHRS